MNPFLRQLRDDPRARVGVGLVVIVGAAAALAPVLSPYDPTSQLDLAQGQLLPPSLRHPLGTDLFSRDLLSRVLYGARLSLTIALFSVLLAATIGTGIGLAAGSIGGVVDVVIMRAVDAGLAVPRVFLLLVVLALWGDVGLAGLVVIFGLTSWFGTSRLVRAEVLSMRERDFVTAARALGLSRLRLTLHHLLPNVATPVIVAATLGIGNIVLIEAGLAYLGVGVRVPTPSLGRIIHDGYDRLLDAPWISIFPGVVLVLIVIGFSLIGDALRESLDPRQP